MVMAIMSRRQQKAIRLQMMWTTHRRRASKKATRESGARSPGGPSRTGLGRKPAKRVEGKGRARGSSTTMAESIAMAGTEQSMATSTRTSAFLVGLDVMWFAMKRISNSVKPILIIPNQFLLFSQLHNLSTHHTHIDSRCASHLDSALHPCLNSLHHV